MEELLELRAAVEEHRYGDALQIINEMEEMAKEDKLNKIRSFIVVLLEHLVKQHAEKRTTPSWERSILFALDSIADTNTRRSAGGMYMGAAELAATIDEKMSVALRYAAKETLGGVYTAKQLAAKIDAEAVKAQALDYIVNGIPESED
jgi:hypothetical protein